MVCAAWLGRLLLAPYVAPPPPPHAANSNRLAPPTAASVVQRAAELVLIGPPRDLRRDTSYRRGPFTRQPHDQSSAVSGNPREQGPFAQSPPAPTAHAAKTDALSQTFFVGSQVGGQSFDSSPDHVQ